MINKMKLALAGAVLATGMISNAAHADTEQAEATVLVMAAVTLSAVADLDFGVVAASAAGGTVSLAASAAATPVTSGVISVGGGSAASFRVTQATDGEVIDLSVGNATALTGLGDPIVLSNLTLSDASITFDSTALQTVYVGGTITLNPNQLADTYTGTFDVTAEYQ